MIVRPFDPTRDSFETLASMNEWPQTMQEWLGRSLARRYMPGSYLVAEKDGAIIGAVLLLDAGAYLAVEGAYLRPEHRTSVNGRALLRGVDAEARLRGTPILLSHAPERIGKALTYYGYVRSGGPYDLYARAVPQET